MSGICGIVNFDGKPVDPELLKKMAEAAAYRGPDGINYWIQGNVGFAHLALHTTPESVREHQPLVNRRGDIVLTADARVDNRDELIRTLTSKGYIEGKNPTDADLIMAAYECWGRECPKHIIGDYVFSVWDSRRSRLLGARDALGVRRFHYNASNHSICFASEAQQLLVHPSVSWELDTQRLVAFLAGWCDNGHRTFFRDVTSLPPASTLLVEENGSKESVYWNLDPSSTVHYKSDQEYADHYLHLFTEIVIQRLRSRSGPIGLLMSGGLDSTAVAAVAQGNLTTGGRASRLEVYSFLFKHFSLRDEKLRIMRMKQELGLAIHFIDAEPFSLLPSSVTDLEMPPLGWEPITDHAIKHLQTIGGKVLLTGQGGDLVLNGSSAVFAEKLLHGEMSAIGQLRDLAREFDVPFHHALYRCIIRPLIPRYVVKLGQQLRDRFSTSTLEPPDWVKLSYRLEPKSIKSLSYRRFSSPSRQDTYDRIIEDGTTREVVYWLERISAHHGVEVRHPFLDRRIVEFVLALPGEQLYREGWRKWILRQSMTNLLPRSITYQRRKSGLRSVFALELQEKAHAQVIELMQNSALARVGIVDSGQLRSAFGEYVQQQTFGRAKLEEVWAFARLELWLRAYDCLLLNISAV